MAQHAPLPVAPSEFLSARETFSGSWTERWLKGPAAERRVRQLRKAFGTSVTTRTAQDCRKLWNESGADRRTLVLTEITFIVPRGAQIPDVEPAKVAA